MKLQTIMEKLHLIKDITKLDLIEDYETENKILRDKILKQETHSRYENIKIFEIKEIDSENCEEVF